MYETQLRHAPVLRTAGDESIETLARVARLRSYSAGEILVREGDLSADFFVLTAGEVEVLRGGMRVATVDVGGFVGERGALDAGPGYAMARSATVRAVTAVDVIVVPGDTLTRCVVRDESLRDALYAEMARRETPP